MFSYDDFLKKMDKCSEDKIKYGVFGGWYGNTLYVFLIFLLARFIVFHLIRNVPYKIGIFILVLMWIGLIVYLFNRKCGIGMGKERLVYVVFKPITRKEKRIFDIPYEKIKYLDVKKFLGINFVKMSFVSDIGKIQRVYYFFSSFGYKKYNIDFKKSSGEILDKLVEMQKVLDKGDF